ncbi:D-alanyl-D-alanine carboxypeptidase family protein [Streptomyces zhihengii]
MPIASVTKVMTAYVILRDHPLAADGAGPRITVDEQAGNESWSGVESTVPVRAGHRLGQRRLLEYLLVASGNNIARLLARWDAGSEEAFVAKMNRAAEDLGMRHTAYTDASGLAPTNVSTARDQLVLARQVMRDAAFRSIVAQKETTAAEVSGPIGNTNALLGEDGVIGVKTGSSTPAGGNLMWAAVAPDRDGRNRMIIGVVLHQRAGTDPRQGMDSAFAAGRTLVRDARQWLSTTSGPR